MRSALASILLLVVVPAAAETRTSSSGLPFCEDALSLRSLIVAMLRHEEPPAAHLDGCTFLKDGVRVEVLRGLGELAPGSRVVAVRVFGNGTSVDGYTLSNGLDDATVLGP